MFSLKNYFALSYKNKNVFVDCSCWKNNLLLYLNHLPLFTTNRNSVWIKRYSLYLVIESCLLNVKWWPLRYFTSCFVRSWYRIGFLSNNLHQYLHATPPWKIYIYFNIYTCINDLQCAWVLEGFLLTKVSCSW